MEQGKTKLINLGETKVNKTEMVKPESQRPDYTEYFEKFKLTHPVDFELLEESEFKGEIISKRDRLIEEVKKEYYPKRAEKAIIRRIKRIAQRLVK